MNYHQRMNAISSCSNGELNLLIKMSIGRILKMGSRQSQHGDIEQYDYCRQLVIDAKDEINRRKEQGK